MRILVIGGTQFMGRETVERLVSRGHDVSVLHRRDHNDFGDGAVRNIQADRGDLPAISRILGSERFEAVLDFAYDWEHGTTAAQVEAAARSCGSELERYVFISSIAAYGGGLDLLEDAPLAPGILGSRAGPWITPSRTVSSSRPEGDPAQSAHVASACSIDTRASPRYMPARARKPGWLRSGAYSWFTRSHPC
jgi:nucleoside-diphosphate-sugar epimerase